MSSTLVRSWLHAIMFALLLTAAPSVVSAQTLTLSVDLDVVPGSNEFGPVVVHRVDEDGDGVADGFLQQARGTLSAPLRGQPANSITINNPLFRLVRVVGQQVCRGRWLAPKELADITDIWGLVHARVDLVVAGRRHELQVQYDTDATEFQFRWNRVKSFRIDRDWVACQ